MHRGMNALVWIVSYVLQLVTYSGLKEKVERERFSSKTGATAVASSVIDVRMTNVLVSVSQIVVLSLHWHTCQILMLQLHKLSYASIQTYINQNKKKKIHQLLLFFFYCYCSYKANTALCASTSWYKRNKRTFFNIFVFLHVTFITKGISIFLLFMILPDTSMKCNSEMSDSWESSKKCRTSSESHSNKRLVKN